MEQARVLVAASASIPESVIKDHLPSELGENEGSTFSYVEGNGALKRVALDLYPGAKGIFIKSRVAARKAIEQSTHLLLLWDGEDLSHVLFEARLQNKRIKLIPVPITRVVNKKNTDNYDVYIGRGSPWGNPFPMRQGEGPTREEVIEEYRKYFYKKISEDEAFKNGILAMKGLRLACFCKPEPCHGDVIADFLDSKESINFFRSDDD